MDALGFALLLLWTDTTANSGKRTGLFQCFGGFKEFTAFYILDETWDVYSYRTTFCAARIGAVQTTFRFCQCLFLGQSLVYFFFAAVGTVVCIQFVHLHARDRCAFFGFHGFAQFLTPSGIAAFFIRLRCAFSGCLACLWLFQFVHFFALNAFECSHAFQHFVEVYLVTVKFRSVYTYEFGLAADGDTAGAAHACSVYHDCV